MAIETCSELQPAIEPFHMLAFKDPQTAIQQLQQQFNLTKSPARQFLLTLEMSFAHTIERAPEQALIALRRARSMASTMQLPGCESRFEQRYGNLYYFIDNTNQALLHYDRALQLMEKEQHSPAALASLLNSLALTYRDLGRFNDAERLFLRAISIYEKVNAKHSLAGAKLNLIAIYIKQNKLELAEQSAESAYHIFEQEDDLRHRIAVLMYLAKIAATRNQASAVLTHFQTAQALVNRSDKPDTWAGDLMAFADSLNTIAEYEQAARLATTFLNTSNGFGGEQVNAHKLLATYYGRKKQHELAFNHLEQGNALENELNEVQNRKLAQFLQAEVEAERKQREIDTLQTATRVLQLETEKRQQQMWLLVVILVFTATIYFVWQRRKQHQMELARANAVNSKLKELDTTKDRMLANTSHELRTPLNGIVGLSELLLLDENLPTTTQEYARMIANSGRRLTAVVNELLEFSRVKNSNVTLHRCDVNLMSCVDDEITLARSCAPLKSVSIGHDISPELMVFADQDRLHQIVGNLLGNAIKFTEQGSIHVSAHHVPGSIKISVSDTGPGISDKWQQRIFDSFEQADSSTTRRHEGLGLGLAICKQLVELHGGQIGVDSVEKRGSTFWFLLPNAKPSQNN